MGRLNTEVEFRRTYEAHFSYVFHTLQRLGIQPADIEDKTHDVFVIVHRRYANFDPSRPMKPWLFGIAYRVASDYKKLVRHQFASSPIDENQPDGGPQPDETIEGEQARELLASALASMDLEPRAILVMHDIDGHSMSDIAATLDIPVNTAYSRLRLAREKLESAARQILAQKKATQSKAIKGARS